VLTPYQNMTIRIPHPVEVLVRANWRTRTHCRKKNRYYI